jgi:hypothetical protein
LNVFLTKYDSGGTLLSARKLGDGEEAQLPRLALTSDGRLLCSAVYSGAYAIGGQALPEGIGDVLLASFTAGSSLEWVNTFGGNELDACSELLADASGDAYLIGNFRGTVTVGNTNLTGAGNTDIFIARCSRTGQFQGAAKAGGAGPDVAFSGVIGASGELRLTGSFSATAQFGSISVTSSDTLAKMFVATISRPPTLRITAFPTHVLLSWPGYFSGFTLESKSELGAASWSPVAGSPSFVNGELVVTNSSSAPRFFRLRK